VDISANLKGAVPKTATQKILLALSEKGELTQKTYGIVFLFSRFLILSPIYVYIYAHMWSGKATFFVANQGNLDALPEQKVKNLADETEALNERNKALAAEIKAASAGTVCVRAFRLI
jgi:26S proteasome regulatory subunit (ATPase 3-interacting protein)